MQPFYIIFYFPSKKSVVHNGGVEMWMESLSLSLTSQVLYFTLVDGSRSLCRLLVWRAPFWRRLRRRSIQNNEKPILFACRRLPQSSLLLLLYSNHLLHSLFPGLSFFPRFG